MFVRILLLFAGMLSVAHAASPELKPFRATYAITWHGMSAGTSQLDLERVGEGRWTYASRSQARGLFRLAMPAELASRSLFRVHEGRVVPELFTADDGASSTEKDQRLEFNWSTGRVSGIVERKRVDLPMQPGLQDTMSVQVALMLELLSGRAPTRFVVVDKEKLKDYVYTAEGTEVLKTAVGEYRTVVYRSNRPGSKNATWFWCAPELGFLPLKVERREGSDVEWFMALKQHDVGRTN
jgi:hypothetical protein